MRINSSHRFRMQSLAVSTTPWSSNLLMVRFFAMILKRLPRRRWLYRSLTLQSAETTRICTRRAPLGSWAQTTSQLGQLMGEEIATALNGKGTVGYVSGPVQVGIVGATTDGLKAKLAEYPDIELVAELDGARDAAKGLAATQDIISSS